MKKFASILTSIAVVAAISACTPGPTPEPTPGPSALAGDWVGGFTLGNETQGLLAIHIAEDGASAEIIDTLGSAVEQSLRNKPEISNFSVAYPDVSFDIEAEGTPIHFSGQAAPSTIDGEVSQDNLTGTFELTLTASLSAEEALAWENAYRFPDRLISLAVVDEGFSGAGKPTLWLVDFLTGDFRAVFPISKEQAIVGAGLTTAYPVAGVLTIIRDGDAVTGLAWQQKNAPEPMAGEVVKLASEEVAFTSGDLTLAGRVTSLAEGGPRPTVVLVHGSDPRGRDGFQVYVHLLANNGYTVFTYDKRGVGDSEGTYVEGASEGNIDNLARDLTAAVAFLKSRPEVDRTHIGVMGWSQAGWIIPLAATRSPDIRYTVIISGPGVSLGEESMWSNFTNNGSVAAPPNWESMEMQVANASPSGVDSIPSIVKMTVPGLWIYGSKDLSQPTTKSAANLERVRSEGGKDISVAVFSDADHSLFINPTGQIADLLVTPGTAPGYFQTIIDWLAEHSMK